MPDEKKAVKKAAAPAKAAKKAAAVPAKRPKAPVKKAVARRVTRAVVRKAAAPPSRPAEPSAPRAPRPTPKPIPTAPVGELPLIGADGAVTGTLALPDALRDARAGDTAVFQTVVAAQANARQANASTKNRARVSGGGAKPWRQKGTGRARQGSTRAPHWRHGGVVFGPNGRRYEQRLPRRVRRAALAASLAGRAAEGRLLVLEALRLPGERPRSRDLVDWLAQVGEVRRAVVVTSELDETVARAAANLRDVQVRTAASLRLVDVLGADTLLLYRDALDALAARAALGREAA